MIDNKEFAILSKANELAECHGLKPTDFLAEVTFNIESAKYELNFMDASPGKASKLTTIARSVGAIKGEVTGTRNEILEALDDAIAKAPKAGRFGR